MKILSISARNYTSFEELFVYDCKSVNMIYGFNNSGKSNFLKLLELIFRTKRRVRTIAIEGGLSETIPVDEGDLNFWEGPVENAQYVFHDGNRTTPITFEIIIGFYLSDLKVQEPLLNIVKEIFYKDHEFVPLKILGEIIPLGVSSAEMKLKEVYISSHNILNYEDSKIKFFKCLESGELAAYAQEKMGSDLEILLREERSVIFDGFLNPLNDCVQFIDSNRYFGNELFLSESSSLSPINLKNWLFSQYLNPSQFKNYESLISFVERFNPDSNEDENDPSRRNSPLANIEINFAKEGELIDLIFRKLEQLRLPISSYGTGIQQIFYILAKIFSSPAKIFLIEELELNLSPRYQRLFLENLRSLIKSNDKHQMFFTSHSSFLSLKSSEYNGVYRISIDDHGNSTAERIENPDDYFNLPSDID